MHFEIGTGVDCDLDILVNTRCLIQANSGGGKSWAIRRLLEQTAGQVQHFVIDPEGEFARETLGDVTGFTASGGTFSTYLGILRRNGLVEVDGPMVRAMDVLFP